MKCSLAQIKRYNVSKRSEAIADICDFPIRWRRSLNAFVETRLDHFLLNDFHACRADTTCIGRSEHSVLIQLDLLVSNPPSLCSSKYSSSVSSSTPIPVALVAAPERKSRRHFQPFASRPTSITKNRGGQRQRGRRTPRSDATRRAYRRGRARTGRPQPVPKDRAKECVFAVVHKASWRCKQ